MNMRCFGNSPANRDFASITLLVPAYNEEATAARVVREALRAVAAVTDNYDAVLLDDGSTDATFTALEAVRREAPDRIRLLRHGTNRGIAAAFEALYRSATKDYVYLVPADGEFPPDAIRAALPLLTKYDVVVCRRLTKPYGLWRSAISYAFRVLPRMLFRVELYDPGSTKVLKSP